ncbi:MAG: serine hydrolase [Acidobacteria bacterium]|nr:serine hydrolase [Acidobacteriota bacterium]
MKRVLLPLLLVLLVAPAAGPIPVRAQTEAKAGEVLPSYKTELAAVEEAIDAKRKELGIPGASIAIVKDDRIIYMKGFGLRNVDKNLAATPYTLYAIGSSTKAFTAMSVVMSADDGKLSLDDAPRKYLPFFKLQDAEADAKITIRDLLSHRSGLNRTDLPWITGKLTRDEIIEVAARAKPTAKLGEKFQYQNVMFLAAGQIVARAENTRFESFVTSRILRPLAMTRSVWTAKAMQESKDHASGYSYNHTTKVLKNLPVRDIEAMAAAGGIYSSAREMAEWLRLMLGGGVYNGKRLVSEKGFEQLTTPQIKIGGTSAYGLGWFLHDWHGHKVVEHGGNIDGFNAQVAFMPDQRLGFVLLTNVTSSPLGAFAMEKVWSAFTGKPGEVAAGPADPAAPAVTPAGPVSEDLMGSFAGPGGNGRVTVEKVDGKISLVVPGQPPYALVPISKDVYSLANLPPSFEITFKRDSTSAVTGFAIKQPQGNFDFTRIAEKPVGITVEELQAKHVAALGGEAAIRSRTSMEATIDVDLESQGLTGVGTVWQKAPAMAASDLKIVAFGRTIATIRSYFDGTAGGELISFAPESTLSGKKLEDTKVESNFYEPLEWKSLFTKVVVARIQKVGDEDCYVVVKTMPSGNVVTDYYSTTTFLQLRRDSIEWDDTTNSGTPSTSTFADYRPVGGLMIPFKVTISNVGNGNLVLTTRDVKTNVPIPDSVFRK